jgi:hypothetical protein
MDRVVLDYDFKYIDKVIPKGTVCTYRSIINSNVVLVQYDYVDDQPQYVGVPISILRLANEEDLQKVTEYNKLIPLVFQIGRKWFIVTGYDENKNSIDKVGEIIDIKLSTNEEVDEFGIKFTDSLVYYSKKYLTQFGSYMPVELPMFNERTTKTDIQVEDVLTIAAQKMDKINESHLLTNNIDHQAVIHQLPPETKQNIEADLNIQIIINGIKFAVTDDNKVSILSEIDVNDLQKFEIALMKLKKMILK